MLVLDKRPLLILRCACCIPSGPAIIYVLSSIYRRILLLAGTNHFGHFALTKDLLPSMKALVSVKSWYIHRIYLEYI